MDPRVKPAGDAVSRASLRGAAVGGGRAGDDRGQACRRRLDHLRREAAEPQHQRAAPRRRQIEPAHGAHDDAALFGGGLDVEIGHAGAHMRDEVHALIRQIDADIAAGVPRQRLRERVALLPVHECAAK